MPGGRCPAKQVLSGLSGGAEERTGGSTGSEQNGLENGGFPDSEETTQCIQMR